MAAFDDEPSLGEKRKPLLAHQIGQNLDDLSAPELRERIGLLRAEHKTWRILGCSRLLGRSS